MNCNKPHNSLYLLYLEELVTDYISYVATLNHRFPDLIAFVCVESSHNSITKYETVMNKWCTDGLLGISFQQQKIFTTHSCYLIRMMLWMIHMQNYNHEFSLESNFHKKNIYMYPYLQLNNYIIKTDFRYLKQVDRLEMHQLSESSRKDDDFCFYIASEFPSLYKTQTH